MTMLSLLLLSGLSFAQSSGAGQVILPEFTPETVSDMQVSLLLYDTFFNALTAKGLRVVSADQVMKRSPEYASECASSRECPKALLTEFGAPLVLVVKVKSDGDNLRLSVAYYGAGGSDAIAVIDEVVPPGKEYALAERTASQAKELVGMLGSGTDPEPRIGPVVTPVRPPDTVIEPPTPVVLQPNPPDPEPEPSPRETPNPPLAITTPPPTGTQTFHLPTREEREQEQRRLGVSDRLYDDYVASGLKADEWMEAQRVRTGSVALEIQGGTGGGALASLYEVVYLVEHDGSSYDFNESAGGNRATQQVLIDPGHRVPGAFGAFGVHVSSHVEVQLVGGVWRTEQQLVRGWVVDSDVYDTVGPYWEQTDDSGLPVAELSQDGSVAGMIEARTRLYARGVGVVKPYALGGVSFLVTSGYQIGDKQIRSEDGTVSAWSYEDPGGMNVPGFVGGAGLMIDPVWRVGLFGEGVYTMAVPAATTIVHTEGGALADVQQSYDAASGSWRVVGGLQLRF